MGVTLRTKAVLYLAGLHLILAVTAFYLLAERLWLLFIVEALFVVLIVAGLYVVRSFFVPLELIRTGSELIRERDFSSKFVPVGQPEMDALIDVYNHMIDTLREERLAAQEQHQLLQKIVDASPAGIVLCNFDGHIERMNPAATRLLGDAALPSLEPGESRLITDSGRRLKVSRAEFRDRGFAKSFYVIEEMTEELRLTEKAAYEKLIRMMSHEVNNSVAAVRSLLESSLQYAPQVGEADREDFRSALTIASARIDALNRFMSGFADVVRIPPPRRAMTSVAQLVERVVALLRPELTSRNISITVDLTDHAEYDVDSAQIEQVVLNVLRNAMEAIARDGAIDVALRGGTLTIADTGPGIPDSARAGLFTPFFTTKREGRGLGLTIVQEILSNHGVAYSLGNRAGGGAEFRVGLR